MKKADAKTLIDIRDAIDRAYDRQAVDDLIGDAQERYERIPESKREGEKAEELMCEISRLEQLQTAHDELSDAFGSLHLDEERSVA